MGERTLWVVSPFIGSNWMISVLIRVIDPSLIVMKMRHLRAIKKLSDAIGKTCQLSSSMSSHIWRMTWVSLRNSVLLFFFRWKAREWIVFTVRILKSFLLWVEFATLIKLRVVSVSAAESYSWRSTAQQQTAKILFYASMYGVHSQFKAGSHKQQFERRFGCETTTRLYHFSYSSRYWL